jgi:type IV fimbrial biogenesis protein FimT
MKGNSSTNTRDYRGVTTLEIMVVVVIVGLLSVLAVPDFRAFLHKHRVATQANEFITDLNLARNEAIHRGARVTMCKSADGVNCTQDGHWDQGWIVFEEGVAVNALRDEGEEVVKVRGRFVGQGSLKGNSPVEDYVSFLPSGMNRRVNGALQCGNVTLEDQGYTITMIINGAGRVRVVKS